MQSWHIFAGIFFFLVACFFYEYGKGQHRIGNETFLTPVFMMGAKLGSTDGIGKRRTGAEATIIATQ